MKRWSPVLLALLMFGVAAGMSLAAVQASAMALKMAAPSQMDHSGSGDCNGCGGAPDDNACVTLCTAHAPAILLPLARLPLPSVKAVGLVMAFQFLHGRTAPPDPGPPRSSDIS